MFQVPADVGDAPAVGGVGCDPPDLVGRTGTTVFDSGHVQCGIHQVGGLVQKLLCPFQELDPLGVVQNQDLLFTEYLAGLPMLPFTAYPHWGHLLMSSTVPPSSVMLLTGFSLSLHTGQSFPVPVTSDAE